MNGNVGGIERPIRIVVGLLLIGIALFGGLPHTGAWMTGIVGAIPLVTGAVGFCPAWTLLGINTCPTRQVGQK